MCAIASQITSLTIVYSTVYSDADERKHQSSASLAFVRGIHRGPVNSPHKWPVTRKMFSFDDVIMRYIVITTEGFLVHRAWVIRYWLWIDILTIISQIVTVQFCMGNGSIGKTPVRIILWCPITKMLIKACFRVQPLEQEGVYQKCCISLCSKVFINHFYQMKASPECLNILTYCSKCWIDRLRRTIGRKV